MLIKIRRQIKSQKGFTLVELLVVVAIIGILAAIAIPKFASASDSAAKAKMQADLRTIDSAISMYYAQKGEYPANIDALGTDYLTTIPKPPTKYKGNAVSAAYGYDTANHRANVTIGSTTLLADSAEWSTL